MNIKVKTAKWIFLAGALLSCASKKDQPLKYLSVLSFEIGDLATASRKKMMGIGQIIAESTTGCPDLVVLQGRNVNAKYLNSFIPCEYSVLSNENVALLTRAPIEGAILPAAKTINTEVKFGNFMVWVIGIGDPGGTVVSDQPGPTIVAGHLEGVETLRSNFSLSEDLIRSNTVNTGTTFDKNYGWRFADQIALSRNSFDRVECRIVDYIPGQRNRESGKPEGISTHFPVLCKASY